MLLRRMDRFLRLTAFTALGGMPSHRLVGPGHKGSVNMAGDDASRPRMAGYQGGYGPQGYSAPFPPAYGYRGMASSMETCRIRLTPSIRMTVAGCMCRFTDREGLEEHFPAHGFFRLEYLLWDVEDPGNTVVGTDLSGSGTILGL